MVDSQIVEEAPRTLVIAQRVEPNTVAFWPFREPGVASYLSKRLFNAGIGISDGRGNRLPYLVEAFSTTLDPTLRAQQVEQMARIFGEELPAVSLYFRSQAWAHSGGMVGPRPLPPESSIGWNVHEWELRCAAERSASREASFRPEGSAGPDGR